MCWNSVFFLANAYLRDTDATSMAASIELRMPLVDQVVVEHVNQLCDHDRFSPLGKSPYYGASRSAGLSQNLLNCLRNRSCYRTIDGSERECPRL